MEKISLRYRFTSESYPLGMVCFGSDPDDCTKKVREFLNLSEDEEIHLTRISETDHIIQRIN